jgi:hypothetical protein
MQFYYPEDQHRHVILGCGATAGWKIHLKCTKWLNYHEEFIIKETTNYNNSFFVKDAAN